MHVHGQYISASSMICVRILTMEHYVILSRRKSGFSSKSHENKQIFSLTKLCLSRYLENRSTYLNKIFTDLHRLSKATCCQIINKIQNFRSFHVIIGPMLNDYSQLLFNLYVHYSSIN